MANDFKRGDTEASWPLRVILGLCVTALIVVGFQLKYDPPSHSATPSTTTLIVTTTTKPTSAPTTTTSTAVSPTTQPSGVIAPLPSPVVNEAAFAQPGRGCHFNSGTAPSTTTTTTPTTTPSTTTLPTGTTTSLHNVATTVSGQCTVLEIGDSLGNDLGWGLAREIGNDHSLKLIQADKSASGLTTPWFYNWPAIEKTLLAQYHPQLVIATFGGNDEQNLVVNGHVVAYGSAPWIKAYTKIVTGIATAATKSGAYVLWVGMPIMAPTAYRQKMVLINSVFLKVAQSVAGMAFLPTWDLFANAHGQYQNGALVNRVPSVLRSTDGIHFSYVGENVIATYVAHELGLVYHVLIAPTGPMYIDR